MEDRYKDGRTGGWTDGRMDVNIYNIEKSMDKTWPGEPKASVTAVKAQGQIWAFSHRCLFIPISRRKLTFHVVNIANVNR